MSAVGTCIQPGSVLDLRWAPCQSCTGAWAQTRPGANCRGPAQKSGCVGQCPPSSKLSPLKRSVVLSPSRNEPSKQWALNFMPTAKTVPALLQVDLIFSCRTLRNSGFCLITLSEVEALTLFFEGAQKILPLSHDSQSLKYEICLAALTSRLLAQNVWLKKLMQKIKNP